MPWWCHRGATKSKERVIATVPGDHRVNERIRVETVRLIDHEGNQRGVMATRDALALARSLDLDLVEIAPTAQPPVCRIIDFGKHKYLEGKLGKDKKSKQQEVKGIKISPRIAEHDLTFNVKKAREFLEEGHKVKVTCMFKAREVTHPELGRKKLDLFAEHLLEDRQTKADIKDRESKKK